MSLNLWDKRVSLIGGAITILGSIGTLLALFNPIGPKDINTYLGKPILISLPPGVSNLPVQLVYEGRPIDRASVAKLEILNSGSQHLGEVGQKWPLRIKFSDGGPSPSKVVPVGQPIRTPSNVVVNILKPEEPNVITLEMELFNPKDKVDLEVLQINPPPDSVLSAKAEARIAGLPEPVSGYESVRNRLFNAFAPPIFIVVLVVIIFFSFVRCGIKSLNPRNLGSGSSH